MIKQIDQAGYATVCQWWQTHGWPVQPPEVLPETGYLCYVNDQPCLAGFMYIPRSGCIGWVEFLVGNPDSSKDDRTTAFKELLEHMEVEARKLGMTMLFTSTSKESLSQRYQAHNYNIFDTNTVQLLKYLYPVNTE